MNWINFSTMFAIAASVLLLLQGVSILIKARKVSEKKEELSNIGWLTILLAGMGMIINILFFFSEIAISREFGVILVQGVWSMLFFALCLLGLILCLSFGLNLTQLRVNQKSWGIWPHLVGLLVWLLSILITVPSINTSQIVNEAPIYLYDLWWPPILLWMVAGFTDITLTILRVRDRTVRVLTSVMLITILVFLVAVFNPSSPGFAHPWTPSSWAVVSILLVPLSVEVFKPTRMLKAKGEKPAYYTLLLHFKKNLFMSIDKQEKHMLAPLALMMIGVIALFSSPSIVGPAPGVILLLAGWGWLTELMTDGWFHVLNSKKGEWFAKEGTVHTTLLSLRYWSLKTFDWLKKILSFSPNWTAVIKVLLIVVVLIVINETFNRGKTIIQPFQAIGFEDKYALTDSADDWLIYDLSTLNQRLQPIIIFPTSSGLQRNKIDYVQAGSVSTSIDAALNNSTELDIGTVKIPANVLVAPVQGVVRPWLKVRIVRGSIISDKDDYVFLVSASDGNTWISRQSKEQNPELNQALPNLVQEVAFLILSSEETIQDYGLTRNWQAFQAYQAGVDKIQLYENTRDYDQLDNAIKAFVEATLTDPYFALAYYRLGLALQQYRQPFRAEAALRRGLSLDPNSVPLMNALAYHLYFYDAYIPFYPAVINVPPKIRNQELLNKKNEARSLWYQIVNLPNSQVLPPDRASAYLGLCNDVMEINNYMDNSSLKKRNNFIAYFYCFKSHTILERLPRDQQSQEKIRQADASALNNLGVIMYKMGISRMKQIEGWVCDPREANNNFFYHPAYTRAALRFYKKALLLQPQDSVIGCNAAIADSLVGTGTRMRELEQIAQAHFVLGSKYLDQARMEAENTTSSFFYYQEALKEYKRAIDLNPSYHEALNAYAYTYWVFRLHWPQERLETPELGPLGNLAAYYAEKAVRLPKMEQNVYEEWAYRRTWAEVLIANGDFERAREILLELNSKVPKSYILDDVRWDLAQVSYCYMEEALDEASKEKINQEAQGYLMKIQQNEENLETYVYTGNKSLTEYRLPCRQFRQSQ